MASDFITAKTVSHNGEGYIRFYDVQLWLVRNRDKKLAGAYTPSDKELIANVYDELISSFGLTWLGRDIQVMETGEEGLANGE